MKVVANVVCTVITTGSQAGAAPRVAEGATNEAGRLARLKLKAPALIAATVPVI